MNKKIMLLIVLLLGATVGVSAEQRPTHSSSGRDRGFVLKTKHGAKITTKKGGTNVRIRSKNFLR